MAKARIYYARDAINSKYQYSLFCRGKKPELTPWKNEGEIWAVQGGASLTRPTPLDGLPPLEYGQMMIFEEVRK